MCVNEAQVLGPTLIGDPRNVLKYFDSRCEHDILIPGRGGVLYNQMVKLDYLNDVF